MTPSLLQFHSQKQEEITRGHLKFKLGEYGPHPQL